MVLPDEATTSYVTGYRMCAGYADHVVEVSQVKAIHIYDFDNTCLPARSLVLPLLTRM